MIGPIHNPNYPLSAAHDVPAMTSTTLRPASRDMWPGPPWAGHFYLSYCFITTQSWGYIPWPTWYSCYVLLMFCGDINASRLLPKAPVKCSFQRAAKNIVIVIVIITITITIIIFTIIIIIIVIVIVIIIIKASMYTSTILNMQTYRNR
jgi:hypothetical protein